MTRTFQALGATALLATLAACGGGGDGGGTGTLRLALTDAPACGYDSVNVTVERVRVHQSSNASDSTAGWSEIVLPQPKTIDLLDLTNGALAELGQTALPAGTYTQLRLVLAANNGNVANANWIELSSNPGNRVPLTTPSGQQSGLKMNVNMTVQPNQTADFVIDFDACKSVVVAGNSGNYNLKPVLRVIPRTLTGVSGVVTQAGSAVSLQQGGTPLRATVADAQGNFVLRPIEPGNYTLVITRPGYATAVVKAVSVPDGQTVVVGSAPIAQDESTDGTTPGLTATVSGKVSTTEATAVDALVSLHQTLSGDLPIELAALPVLSATPTITTQGTYAFAGLPLNDPRVATYSASGAALSFATDASVAGKLTVRAIANGVTKDTAPLTLAADTNTSTSAGDLVANFIFP